MQREELKEILREVLNDKGFYFVKELVTEIQKEEILKLFELKEGNVVKYENKIGVVFAYGDELRWRKLKRDNSLYKYETYLCSRYSLGRVEKIAETYDEYLQTLNK